MSKFKLDQDALKYAYEKGGFVVHGWSVYQVFYSKNIGFYMNKIYTHPRTSVPLANRGFWLAFGPEYINRLVEFDLLNV